MKRDWRLITLYLTAFGMEGCWLYAVLDLLNKKAVDGVLALPGLLLVYPLSFGFHLLLWRRLRAYRSIASGLAWVAVLLLTVKFQVFPGAGWMDARWLLAVPRGIGGMIYGFSPALVILLSTGVLWWLGGWLAEKRLSFSFFLGKFQFGLVMLLIAYLLAPPLGIALGSPVPVVLLFFLMALPGISVAHALEGTSWLSGLYRGHWSGLLLLSVGLVLALGVLISAILTPELLQIFWTVVKWGWGLVWDLITRLLDYLASLMPASEPGSLPEMPAMPAGEPEEEQILISFPPWLRSLLRTGWAVIMVGSLLFALWRIASDIIERLRRRLALMSGAEFVPMPGAFRADLRALLRRLFGWLGGAGRIFRRRRGAVLPPEVISVRQVYRQLLRWAAVAGLPRQSDQTPHEYGAVLAAALPDAVGDLDFITQQYVRARYGAHLPHEEDLRQLGQRWQRVKGNRFRRGK
ncbi:MAG: DUF4129 domain-containing protein [Chloroflexota bacterium]